MKTLRADHLTDAAPQRESLVSYIFAAVLPVVLIAALIVFLLFQLNQDLRGLEAANSELDIVLPFQRVIISLQKARGLEQVILKKDAGHQVLSALSRFHNAIISLQRVRGLEKVSKSQKMIWNQIVLEQREFIQAIDALTDGDLSLTAESIDKLSEIKARAKKLFFMQKQTAIADANFSAYTALIGDLQTLMLMQSYNLHSTLSQHEKPYYLLEMHTKDLPSLMESVGRLRGYGSGLVGAGDQSSRNKHAWLELAGAVEKELEDVMQKKRMVSSGHFADPQMSALLVKIKQKINDYVNLTNQYIKSGDGQISAMEYFAKGTDIIDLSFALCKSIDVRLGKNLKQEIASLNHHLSYIYNGGIIGIGLLLYFVTSFYRKNNRAVRRILEANETIRKGDDHIRKIINLIPHIIVVRDVSGRIVLANEAFAKAIGFDVKNLRALPPGFDDAAEEVFGRLFTRDQDVVASGKSLFLKEEEYQDCNGTKRIFQTAKIPYDTEDGKTSAVLTVCTDITDAKRVRDLQKVAGVGYWEWNLHTDRVYFSDEFYEIIDRDKGLFDGNFEGFMHLVCDDDRERLSEAVEEALTRQAVIDVEFKITKPFSQSAYLRMQSQSYCNPYTEKQMIVGTIQDISSEKRAMEQLEASERKFRQLVENLRDEYFFYSCNSTGRLTYVSPSIENVLGYQADDVLTLRRDSASSETIADLYKKLAERAGAKRSGPFEIEVNHQDGEVHYLELNEVPVLDAAGDIVQVDGIAHDTTARRFAEENLRASETRLRELALHLQDVRERERELIAHDIHDDLGGYLTALNMDVGLLARRVKDPAPDVKEKLDSIRGLVGSAIEAVRRIITNLRPTVLDELGLVEAIEWQVREFGGRYNINVDYNKLFDDNRLTLQSSECAVSVFRIFQEILTNIARHSGADRVSVFLHRGEEHFSIAVSDNGCGMADEARNQKGSYGILGMQERINKMGGQLTMHSTVDMGTTVALSMPVCGQPAQQLVS